MKHSKPLLSIFSLWSIPVRAQIDSCIVTNFDSPTVVNPNLIVESVYSVTQTVNSDVNSNSCVEAFLSAYYTQLKCQKLDPTTNLVQNLESGFSYLTFINRSLESRQFDANGQIITPALNPLTNNFLTNQNQLWEYKLSFNYEIFSQNCQENFAEQFIDPAQVAKQMSEAQIPSSACASDVNFKFLPFDATYKFEISQDINDNVCKNLECSQKSADPSTFGQDLYLECIPPISTFCITASCVPECFNFLDASSRNNNSTAAPVISFLKNANNGYSDLLNYCDNGAQCSQDQLNPVDPPTCDCSSISIWSVYYVGSKCGTVLHLWWLLLIALAIILLFLLLFCLCCSCCPLYKYRNQICCYCWCFPCCKDCLGCKNEDKYDANDQNGSVGGNFLKT